MGSPTLEWREKYTGSTTTNIKAQSRTSVKHGILNHTNKKWIDQKHGLSKEIFSLAVDLIDKCLRISPKDRITAENALKHPLFTSFHLHVVRGHETVLPITPNIDKKSTFNKTYSLIRKDLIRNTINDIEQGYMEYYPSIMAISIFDRIIPLMWNDITMENSLHTDKIQHIYCASYLLGTKLMTSKNSKTSFEGLKGIICGLNEKSKYTILYFERVIIEKLKFIFHSGEINMLPMSLELMKKLEKQTFNIKKFKLM
jgi:serine/threonine protein kinase